jgi:predicted site-specific integrase-resolvase
MSVEIITKEDLKSFKEELLNDLKKFVTSPQQTLQKKWLKSQEVRILLKISPGTLQNLRVNGTLTYTKIGGTLYYNQDDIQKLLEQNKN